MLNAEVRREVLKGALLVLALLAGFAGTSPAASTAPAASEQQSAVPADLDSYIAGVLRTFDVPGVSVAIVKDGKVVLAKGYGVRKLGDATAVDDRTLFGIASNTKVFTAIALGLLVEEGKVGWDTPVIRYLPWFRLSDPYVTRELTIRDLLVHRSGLGLGSGDLLWWPASTYTRPEIARRLKDLPLVTSFRSAYAYDNVLYLIAGEVIESVSGQSWEDFVSSRILKKVGMTGSNVRHSDATERRERRDAARAGGRQGRAREAVRLGQHESCGRHQLQRAGHGKVDVGAARARPARGRQPLVLRRDLRADYVDRDAAPGAADAARALRPATKLRWLRARPQRRRLQGPQGLHAHRRPARLRVEGLLDAVGAAWRDGPHEPGIVRGVRLDRLSRGGSLPRRAGIRLVRGVQQAAGGADSCLCRRATEGNRNAGEGFPPVSSARQLRRHLHRFLVR